MAGVLFIFILLFVKESLTSDHKRYGELKTKYKELTMKYEELATKYKDLTTKYKESTMKHEELAMKYKELKDREQLLALENQKYKNQELFIENIYNEIEKKLIEAVKDDKYVKIDTENQELILDDSVLFDTNQWQLKEEGRNALRSILPKFFSIFLDDSTILSYLEQLIIEGHTDDTGPGSLEEKYLYNLNLSQKRAFEVANFIYSDEILKTKLSPERLKKLKIYLSSNGKSDANPIYIQNDVKKGIDRNKSRRVTIKYKIDIQKIRKLNKKGEEKRV